MNQSQAINAASRAAQTVMAAVDGAAARSFAWTDALDLQADVLAQFCETHPDATACELYHFGVRAQPRAVPWETCHPAQRAAVATFQGTYLALAKLVVADMAPGTIIRHIFTRRGP